jgi:hypothetical protein
MGNIPIGSALPIGITRQLATRYQLVWAKTLFIPRAVILLRKMRL